MLFCTKFNERRFVVQEIDKESAEGERQMELMLDLIQFLARMSNEAPKDVRQWLDRNRDYQPAILVNLQPEKP